MPFSWQHEDEGLPITFGQVSNGEYQPEPISDVRLELVRLANLVAEDAIV
jgi:hypothetical protein